MAPGHLYRGRLLPPLHLPVQGGEVQRQGGLDHGHHAIRGAHHPPRQVEPLNYHLVTIGIHHQGPDAGRSSGRHQVLSARGLEQVSIVCNMELGWITEYWCTGCETRGSG